MKVHRKKINKTKGNIIVLLFLFTMLVSVFAITFRIHEVLASGRELKNAETVVYVVQKGDTLWSIAKETGFENLDIREIVHRIKQLNNLDSSTISPGDVLIIPIIPEK
jgi:LysM repeat protein